MQYLSDRHSPTNPKNQIKAAQIAACCRLGGNVHMVLAIPGADLATLEDAIYHFWNRIDRARLGKNYRDHPNRIKGFVAYEIGRNPKKSSNRNPDGLHAHLILTIPKKDVLWLKLVGQFHFRRYGGHECNEDLAMFRKFFPAKPVTEHGTFWLDDDVYELDGLVEYDLKKWRSEKDNVRFLEELCRKSVPTNGWVEKLV